MDECETAATYAERWTAFCLALQQSGNPPPRIPSARHCAACDTPIPEGQRRAQPGCQLCVRCQAAREQHHGW